MKNFFKDFWELQKQSNQFMKNHWFGYSVITLTCSAALLIPMYLKAKKEAKETEKTVESINNMFLSTWENAWENNKETNED